MVKHRLKTGEKPMVDQKKQPILVGFEGDEP